MKKVLVEFIGTFFLVLTIGLAVLSPTLGSFAPIAIGFVLIAVIYAGGPISGAHYNPAVTLAVFLAKKCTLRESIHYLGAQLLAGVLAACGALYMTGVTGSPPVLEMGPAFLAEVIFTFALVFVILMVAFSKTSKGNQYFGLAIGFTVMAGAYAVGAISGGVFNPAVAVALNIMSLSEWSMMGLYLGSQLIGSLLAWRAFVYIEGN
jgi:aquaporin Z